MERKARLLMAATLPLYLGPLLAGLSGMSWAGLPVFAALFALWFVVMRPHEWPRQLSGWTGPVVLRAAAQIAINMVIVVILFGIGRGLAGVAGLSVPLPPFIPVALSFLSIPLSRLAWDPVKGQQMEAVLDDALAQIEGFNRGTLDAQDAGAADPMLTALLDLPDDADPVLTAEALDSALRAPGAALRLSQLEDELDYARDKHLGLREALILWATDADRSVEDKLHGVQLTAFYAAGSNPHLLHLFARRAIPLLQAQPGLWYSYPDPSTLGLALQDDQPAALQDSLRALSDLMDRLTPPDERLSGMP